MGTLCQAWKWPMWAQEVHWLVPEQSGEPFCGDQGSCPHYITV